MRWRPRLLIVGARRGVPVALVVAVAHALGYMGRTSAWQGIWAETVAHWNSAAILSMPAAASMAAWLSAANRRDALARLESVASRSPWVVRLRTWAEVSCWVVLGLVMGCAPGVVMTFRRATFGSLDVTACAPVVAFVLSGVALGLLAGHVVPWTLGAPLIGVVTYVFFGVMDAGAHSLTQVVTPIDGRWMTYHRTSPSLLVARTALWLLVTAALLARWGGRARSALLLTWLAGIAAAPLLFVGSGDRVVVEPAAELRCAQTEGQVEVCLTASKSYLVPSLSKHAQQVFDTVEGLIDAPLRIVGDEARGLSYSTDEQIQELLIPGESGSVYAMSAIYDLSAAAEADRNAFLGGFAAVLFPDSPGREHGRGVATGGVSC